MLAKEQKIGSKARTQGGNLNVKKNGKFPNRERWSEKYGSLEILNVAKEVLQKEDQSEEAFLGAQGVLMLHGLI
jgi:hypothetical protein